jgi:ABC-2 type transport system ATP-binding protein
MIETHDLTKHFEDFVAVQGVNLHVPAGEALALLGPNGAGKTTTVRMLTSLLTPTRGWAKVAGFDVAREAAKVRASVGVLTENHGLYNRMPADEYLDFYGEVYGLPVRERRARMDDLLERFGLGAARRRKVGEYSKGMRQKLALARALMHHPPVLLLDEPTSAMDPESAKLVRDAIAQLQTAERAIIICTHNLLEAEELAHRIAIIRDGQIIANGTPRELKSAYLGAVEYEVRMLAPANGRVYQLPEGVTLTGRGEDWLRFSSPQGAAVNPFTLQKLLEQGVLVASLQEVPRSLEEVYLAAMKQAKEADDAG